MVQVSTFYLDILLPNSNTIIFTKQTQSKVTNAHFLRGKSNIDGLLLRKPSIYSVFAITETIGSVLEYTNI